MGYVAGKTQSATREPQLLYLYGAREGVMASRECLCPNHAGGMALPVGVIDIIKMNQPVPPARYQQRLAVFGLAGVVQRQNLGIVSLEEGLHPMGVQVIDANVSTPVASCELGTWSPPRSAHPRWILHTMPTKRAAESEAVCLSRLMFR